MEKAKAVAARKSLYGLGKKTRRPNENLNLKEESLSYNTVKDRLESTRTGAAPSKQNITPSHCNPLLSPNLAVTDPELTTRLPSRQALCSTATMFKPSVLNYALPDALAG